TNSFAVGVLSATNLISGNTETMGAVGSLGASADAVAVAVEVQPNEPPPGIADQTGNLLTLNPTSLSWNQGFTANTMGLTGISANVEPYQAWPIFGYQQLTSSISSSLLTMGSGIAPATMTSRNHMWRVSSVTAGAGTASANAYQLKDATNSAANLTTNSAVLISFTEPCTQAATSTVPITASSTNLLNITAGDVYLLQVSGASSCTTAPQFALTCTVAP